MKKIISLFLALCLMLALCACGAQAPAATPDPTVEPIPEDIMNQPAAPGEGPNPVGMPTADANMDEEAPEGMAPSDSLGNQLQSAFLETAGADPAQSPMDVFTALMASPALSFGPVAVEVEPGLLTGFGNAEITGFEQGVMFAPMIGSIPFVGYIFRLAEDADTHAFADLLEENADPRWNICTEAEQTVIAISDSLVFFVMCPLSMEG